MVMSPAGRTGTMRKRLPRASGFTLVEMMVVVAIVGVLAMLAAAGYERLGQRAALQNATFDLQGALSWARSRAIERGSNVWVIIYPQGKRNAPTGGKGAYFVYEDLTMRFAKPGEPTFGYDDFRIDNSFNPLDTEGQLLQTNYMEDYKGGAISFARVGSTVFPAPFTGLAPVACSVCVGGGSRGALVFTGDGTVRFYDGAGALLSLGDVSLALGNTDDKRGYIFGISGATAFVAAEASY